MTATIEPLLRSPRLPALIEELQGVLAEERARRERFHQEIFDAQVNLRARGQMTQG